MIGLYQAGISQGVIARTLNRSKQTVNLWITRFRNEGIADLVTRERSGRVRETTVYQDMAIITASKLIFSVVVTSIAYGLFVLKGILNPFDSAEEVRETANVQNISIKILRTRLRNAGIYGRRPSKKIFLTDVRKAERLRFAREHIHYKVIFSAEKTLSTNGYSPQWVYRLPGGRHEASNLARSTYSTRKTINVWGCVSYHGPGVLHRIEGRLNMHSYLDIKGDHLV